MSLVMRDPSSTPTPTPDTWLDDESLFGPPSSIIEEDSRVLADRDAAEEGLLVVQPIDHVAAPPTMAHELASAAVGAIAAALVVDFVLSPFLKDAGFLVCGHVAANLMLGGGLAIARSGAGGRAAKTVGWGMAIGSPVAGVMAFSIASLLSRGALFYSPPDLMIEMLHVPSWLWLAVLFALVRIPAWEWSARSVEPELGERGYTLLAAACGGVGLWFLVFPPVLAEPAIFAVTRNFALDQIGRLDDRA